MTPDDYTITETILEVGDGHSLYAHEWGNPKAKTNFVFLHGGPGSGCSDTHKLLFNPRKNRVIFFDQRGSGKSTPYGSLKNNQTENLISDITKIADEFGLKQFVVVGRSWGSTLALAYALAEPERVKAMVIGGVFTGSQQEVDDMEKGGIQKSYPEVWQALVDRTPKKYRHDPTSYHIPRALGDDPEQMLDSCYAMSEFEGSIMSLDERRVPTSRVDFDPNPVRIEISYTSKLCYMPDNHLLDNAHKLKMPISIIQGRYDFVCLPNIAYELDKRLPNSSLIWTLAGHSGRDRANVNATQTAIASFA